MANCPAYVFDFWLSLIVLKMTLIFKIYFTTCVGSITEAAIKM